MPGFGWRNPRACSRRSRTGHPPLSPAHRRCRETRSWWRCPGSCFPRRRQCCPARKRKPVQGTDRAGGRRCRGGHKSVSNNITLQSFSIKRKPPFLRRFSGFSIQLYMQLPVSRWEPVQAIPVSIMRG